MTRRNRSAVTGRFASAEEAAADPERRGRVLHRLWQRADWTPL